MTKRNLDSEEHTISGYIHSTSPVKQAMSSNVRYFDGQIQTSDTEFIRFVSFNPEKINHFQSAETGKTPVKLQNVKITPKRGSKEITVHKSTTIEVSRALKFERKTEVPTADSQDKQLAEIKTPGIMCSLNVKMLVFFDEERSIKTKYGERKVRTAIVADQSGSKRMSLWSGNITKMKKDEFYRITNVVSSMFEGEINVSSTAGSTFSTIEPLDDIQESLGPIGALVETIGSILSCRLTASVKCVHCNKTLSVQPETPITKCDHCQSRQRVLPINRKKTLHLKTTTTDNETKNFVAFNDVVEQFIRTHSLDSKSDTEIEEFLLLQDQVTIGHKPNTDVVTNIV